MEHLIKNRRSYLLTSPYALHQLLLEHKLLREKSILFSPPNPAIDDKLKLLDKVLDLIQQQGDAILDEADMILDMSKEVKISRGNQAPLSTHAQDLTKELFEIIFTEPTAKDLQVKSNTDAHFKEDDYHNIVKPAVANRLLEWLKKRYPTLKLSAEQEVLFFKYLCSDTSIDDIPDFISLFKEDGLLELVGSIRKILQTFLPFTVTQTPDKHYGLSKTKTGSYVCIPYDEVTKLPKEGSEFSLPYETMLCTALYICKVGISKEFFSKFIKQLKTAILLEQRQEGIPMEETAGYKKAVAAGFCDKKAIFSLDESDIDLLQQEYDSSIEKRLKFACEFGLKEMTFYPSSYSSTALDLSSMCHTVQGFTGILRNQGLAKELAMKPAKGIDGMIISLLKEKDAQVIEVAHMSPDDTFDPLFDQLIGYEALIEAGAWFKGVSNTKMAKHLNLQSFNTVLNR